MIKEFKQFISKGNVVDLAVGVVVGGAFSKIVTSLVDDIIMPIIGVIIGGIDFSSLAFNIKDASVHYGLFIQNVVDFLIIAFCIFLVVRFLNRLEKLAENEKKKLGLIKEEVKEEPKKAEVSEEIKLLREISKSLKSQNKKPAKKTVE